MLSAPSKLGEQGIQRDAQRIATLLGLCRNPYKLEAVYAKTLADNAATAVFTITTTNETGDNDAGGYSAFVRAHIIDGNVAASGATAVVAWEGIITRAMEQTGTGVVAVAENHETASTDTNAANRTIAAVTMTVTETSEYVMTVNLTVDHQGASPSLLTAVVSVELLWYGFTTPPALAAA